MDKTRNPGWHPLPTQEGLREDLPRYSTVYWHYKPWREAGGIEKLMNVLHGQVREQVKKTEVDEVNHQLTLKPSRIPVMPVWSQRDASFDKSTNGIKRHLAVEPLGFPLFTHCTKARVSDDVGLLEMLTLHINYFQSKPVNIPQITILLDHGYHLDYLIEQLEKVYPQIMTKIRFELSTKPSKQEKAAPGKSGFVPAVARWVIERSKAWMECSKSLVKNFERTLSHATTKINLCLVRLMLKGLAALSELSNGFYRERVSS